LRAESVEDEEEAAEKEDETYPLAPQVQKSISWPTLALLVFACCMLYFVYSSFLVPPRLAIVNSTGPITYTTGVGKVTVLYPGSPGYNTTLSNMEANNDQLYQSQLNSFLLDVGAFQFVMLVLFIYSYGYVTTATRASGMLYVFIFSSLFALGGFISLGMILLNFSTYLSSLGGVVGLAFAYWKLRGRGFI
jgi:hypothetical protein